MASATNRRYLARTQGHKLEPDMAPEPTIAAPNELLIRLKAIAINPADIKMVDEGHRVASWPIVPGLDGAGIVEAVGNEVKAFAVGDEVLAQFMAGPAEKGGGSYQNFAVVQEGMVAKKPEWLSWSEAASIPVCYFTAMVGLGTGLGIPLPFLAEGPITGFTPATILVLGGSSALGASAIQLIRLALPGSKILVTASSKHHTIITERLGAHVALDRSSTSLIADIRDSTPASKGVDAILDTVGAGATERHIFQAFSVDGPKRYAQVWTGDDEIEVPSGVDSVLFRSRDYLQIQGGKNILWSLQTLLAEGLYKAPLPVRQVGNSINALESGLDLMRKGVSGEKLVVLV